MLTHIQIVSAVDLAKQNGKGINLSDTNGIQLRISPQGNVAWWCRKRRDGKLLSKRLGDWPSLTIKEAHAEATLWLAQLVTMKTDYTVREAFNDWSKVKSQKALSFDKIQLRLEKHVLRKFAKWKMEDLTAPALIEHWKTLELSGKSETIKKLCGYVRQIATFTINTGRVEHMHDLTHLSENYAFTAKKHMPAVTPDSLPQLFQVLRTHIKTFGMSYYLTLASFYTLSRPSEISALEWSWCDFEAKTITFPAAIMKMKKVHVIPMSEQLYALLMNVPRLSQYVFTGYKPGTHLNKETVRALFKRAGLTGTQTAHGIRSIGRTWMAQQNIPNHVAESCLAHKTGSNVELSYQRYDYLNERRAVMQSWCDYVEECTKEESI